MEAYVTYFSKVLDSCFNSQDEFLKHDTQILLSKGYTLDTQRRPFVFMKPNGSYLILFSRIYSNIGIGLENQEVYASYIEDGFQIKKIKLDNQVKYLILEAIINNPASHLNSILFKLHDSKIQHVESNLNKIYTFDNKLFIGLFYGLLRFGTILENSFQYHKTVVENETSLYNEYIEYIKEYLLSKHSDVTDAATILCAMKHSKVSKRMRL
jgi:hypothetical protein